VRLGLLGLGRIGAFHAETLACLPVVDSLVVSDLSRAVTAEVAARVGAEAVDSVADVLGAGVDGVVIAAGTEAHPALLAAAVQAGVPAFCEKPITRTVAESVALRERVESAGAVVQVGYQRRFDAGFRAARAAVQSGELGWLHTVRSTTLDPFPPSPAYVAASGGLYRDCGVHDFDAVRWVTGREVVEAYAIGSNRGEEFFAAAADVDTGAAVLTLDDGTLAVVSLARYNARGYDVRLEVHGSQDSIAVGLDDRLPLRSVEPGTGFPSGVPYPVFMERFLPAYRTELEAFTDVVAGRIPSPCTVADALQAEWVAEACARSARARRPVLLSELTGPGG
jgi:myo-inositol 2-dehydrogenase / D-chiro-inositol 1-dehydrogenase